MTYHSVRLNVRRDSQPISGASTHPARPPVIATPNQKMAASPSTTPSPCLNIGVPHG